MFCKSFIALVNVLLVVATCKYIILFNFNCFIFPTVYRVAKFYTEMFTALIHMWMGLYIIVDVVFYGLGNTNLNMQCVIKHKHFKIRKFKID